MIQIYVGRIPANTTEDDLLRLFSAYDVKSATIVRDSTTGESRGIALVDIDGDPAAAVRALNGYALHGRKILVAVRT